MGSLTESNRLEFETSAEITQQVAEARADAEPPKQILREDRDLRDQLRMNKRTEAENKVVDLASTESQLRLEAQQSENEAQKGNDREVAAEQSESEKKEDENSLAVTDDENDENEPREAEKGWFA